MKLPAAPQSGIYAALRQAAGYHSGIRRSLTRLSILRSRATADTVGHSLWRRTRTGALRWTLRLPVAIPLRASARGILAKASENLRFNFAQVDLSARSLKPCALDQSCSSRLPIQTIHYP
jgi:hypothetical protein